ncbi:TetR/AcrR family transcriptional regulator [Streptomyces hoynatensis]|uniref:TetR/AcrR family transcriptional regulator n=1 Tax=Streptomyces hoynatensis TaxID=1141874 RepID=UPI001319EDA9|nr:TetR/AcrR family transcriptional regulator [Streptomyces hoynatensis]
MSGTQPRADARRNRENLVRVAREVFAESGTDASLRDIARRAGVGIGTLYRHFPTREDLLGAALSTGLGALREEAHRGLGEQSPGEALFAWMETFASRSSVWCGVPGSVMEALHGGRPAVQAAFTDVIEAVADLLARAQREGTVRGDVDAEDVITAASALGWVSEKCGPAYTARLLAVVRDGLGVPRDGSAPRPLPAAPGLGAPPPAGTP